MIQVLEVGSLGFVVKMLVLVGPREPRSKLQEKDAHLSLVEVIVCSVRTSRYSNLE